MGSFLDNLSPHVSMTLAVAPILLALLLRLITGKNRLTTVMTPASVVWFAISILLAPYSSGMRRDLEALRMFFR